MSELRCILFDLDGTLYDQRRLRRTLLLRLLRHAVMHPLRGPRELKLIQAYRRAQEALREDCGKPQNLAELQLRRACETAGMEAARAAQVIHRWINHVPLPYLKPAIHAGVPEFLEAAKSRGLRMGVVSDYPAQDKLQAMDIAHYFDVLVSAQDADQGYFKPHPNGLLVAMQRLGVTPGETIYIGDRQEVDGEAARRAGMRFYLYAPVPPMPARENCDHFDSYLELRGRILGQSIGTLSGL